MRRQLQLSLLTAVLKRFERNKKLEFLCNEIIEEAELRGIKIPDRYNYYEVSWIPALRKRTPKGHDFGDCWFRGFTLKEKRVLKMACLIFAINDLKQKLKK